jgi:hypothetical protein
VNLNRYWAAGTAPIFEIIAAIDPFHQRDQWGDLRSQMARRDRAGGRARRRARRRSGHRRRPAGCAGWSTRTAPRIPRCADRHGLPVRPAPRRTALRHAGNRSSPLRVISRPEHPPRRWSQLPRSLVRRQRGHGVGPPGSRAEPAGRGDASTVADWPRTPAVGRCPGSRRAQRRSGGRWQRAAGARLAGGGTAATVESLTFQHAADGAATLLAAAAAYERLARAADAMAAASGRLTSVDDGRLHISYGRW